MATWSKLLADGTRLPAKTLAAGDSGFIIAGWGATDEYETTIVNSRPRVDGTIDDVKVMPPQRDRKKVEHRDDDGDEEDAEEADGRRTRRRPAAAAGAAMKRPSSAFPALAAGVSNLELIVVAGHQGAQTVVLKTLAKDKKQILNISMNEADDPTLLARRVINDIMPSIVTRPLPALGTVASLPAELVEEFREMARSARRARLTL